MKRKNVLLIEKKEDQKRYEQELAETQIEIREETLRNISWELHDNIGQLLTLAKIQTQNAAGHADKIDEAVETIGKGLTELRALSKLINPDALKSLSLAEALQLELDRFNRMEYIKTILRVRGIPIEIENKVETVIFRMLQEFFTNTIKHSKASHLEVDVQYRNDTLFIEVKDDGIGFNYAKERAKNGIGLTNIESRARLIKAVAFYESAPEKGTILKLTYKPPHHV